MQVVCAAAVDPVCCGILADRQSVHESLSEIVLVFRQDCFQGAVQKRQVLFQLREITLCDGGEPLSFFTEAIFALAEILVLTKIFSVCVVCGGL